MKFFLPFVAFFMLFSCGTSTYKGGLQVTGRVGEVLVVCDQGIWDSPVKEVLDSHLTQFIMPYFPDVATFELIHRTDKKFDGPIRRHRNILFLRIDPKVKDGKGRMDKRKSVWADHQMVIEVVAKDYNQLLEVCDKGLRSAHNEFDYYEWYRIMKYFQESPKGKTAKRLKEYFGISLALPEGAVLVSGRKNFCRIELPVSSRPIEFVGSGTQDAGAIMSGIMVYQYKYTGAQDFDPKVLLQARDTMLKYNVPHEIPGLYMGTQYNELVYPESSKTTNFSGTIKGVEMRGMFMFTGRDIHSTGGAFWSFHFLHPKTQKVVCISGYVDAPSTTSWTHPLREVEAIWKSVEIE
ncbi:MAG: hypothetical protein RL264_339 [Bacteroidota bacterium]|jgi:hypothetical protein